jgi:ATP-dependent Lon protease
MDNNNQVINLYKTISKIIINTIQHLNHLYDKKQQIHVKLESIMGELNRKYNEMIVLKNIEYIVEYVVEYDNVIKKIIDVFCECGGELGDIIYLVCDYNIYYMLDVINGFVASSVVILDEAADIKATNIKAAAAKIIEKDNMISISIGANNNDNLVKKYNIYVDYVTKEKSKYFIIEGSFNNSITNFIMKSLRYSNNYVYMLKNNIIKGSEIYFKKNNIMCQFAIKYINNLMMDELLVLKQYDIAFYKKIAAEYEKYSKYTNNNMTFKDITADFIIGDIKQKHDIIKILLSGDEDNKNNGIILFGLLKDGMPESSKQIYDCLPLQMQKLLVLNDIIDVEPCDNKQVDLVIKEDDILKIIKKNNSIPEYVKKIAYNKIEEIKINKNDVYKNNIFINAIRDYPWIKDEEDKTIFDSIKINKRLNEAVYGHKECKDIIMELVSKWNSNSKSMGRAIGIYGPPGTGKTLFAKNLGHALNMPLGQINLAGLEDGSVLTGHSITYNGAVPGMIVKKMVELGKPRSIIYFDELDKVAYKNGKNEIMDILINITDMSTNNEFNDKFFQDIKFPLNKVLFIFSFNDINKINKILLDRMDMIEIKPYNIIDKISIAKKYLLKHIIADIGLKINVLFDDDIIEYIIYNYTAEYGVRELKRMIEKILLKINRIYIKKNKSKTKPNISISIKQVDEYLGGSKQIYKQTHDTPLIGIINGLYVTQSRESGIMPISIYKNNIQNNKFELITTGQHGDIMKESIMFSYTIATMHANKICLDKFFIDYPNGLHIHTPDGMTPKDGASGGAAFTIAFLSVILNKEIPNTIALTGEINIEGKITGIGDIEYKLLGAKRAGIKKVYVPKENEKEYKSMMCERLISDNFRVVFVNHINDIVKELFV